MTTQTFSQAQAAKIAGVARNTISSHMKSGKLSYTLNAQGQKVIEASELMRVYSEKCNFDIVTKGKGRAGSSDQKQQDSVELLLARKEIEHLKAMNAKLEEDIDHFKQQDDARRAESIQYHALLTDQREQSSQFEKTLSTLLSKQDDLQKQLNEKPKSFIAKLLGS